MTDARATARRDDGPHGEAIIAAVPASAPDRPTEPLLAILVANWNTAALIERCVEAILAQVSIPLELVVVDNGSSDGSVDLLRRIAARDPRVILVSNPRNYGYAHANNQAYARARAPWVALLNSDVTVRPGALEQLLEYARAHGEVGITSCVLVGDDGREQTFHRRFPDPWTVALWFNRWGRRVDRWLLGGAVRKRYLMAGTKVGAPLPVDQAGGACMILSRAVVEAAGGLFDEAFPLFFNDVDLSRRIHALGLAIHVLPVALDHGGGVSIRRMRPEEQDYHRRAGIRAYFDKHGTPWERRVVRVFIGVAVPPPGEMQLVPPPAGSPPRADAARGG
jgi:GT2 family glycosyltransferase